MFLGYLQCVRKPYGDLYSAFKNLNVVNFCKMASDVRKDLDLLLQAGKKP